VYLHSLIDRRVTFKKLEAALQVQEKPTKVVLVTAYQQYLCKY